MSRDVLPDLTEVPLTSLDFTLNQLQERREGILATAMHSYLEHGEVPDALHVDLISTNFAINTRVPMLEEMAIKAGTNKTYFDMLVEEDDLREAAERSFTNGEVFELWQEKRKALRDYEATHVYR